MDLNQAIKIFKNLYSDEFEEEEKMKAIKTISLEWCRVFKKISKKDLLLALEYVTDILGK